MGLLYTGRVMRIDPAGPVIRVPLLGRDALWGPVVNTVGGLLTNEQIIVGQLGASRDQLVVLARLNVAGGIDDATQRMAAIETLLAEHTVRLTSVESRVTGLTISEDRYGLVLASLRERLGAVEWAASTLPPAGLVGDLADAVTVLRADVDNLSGQMLILDQRVTALDGGAVGGGGSTGGGGTDPGGGGGTTTPAPSSPGAMIPMAKWELTLPVGTAGNPDDIYYSGNPNLATYVHQNYFYIGGDSASGYYTEFAAPVTGTGPDGRTIVTTSSASGASRCELREMVGVGSSGEKAAWTFADGLDHIMTVTMTVDPTGITGRKEIIIGQIHGATGTPPLYLAANFNGTPKITVFKNGTSSQAGDILSGQITASTKFTYRIAKTATGRVKLWYALGDESALPATAAWDWAIGDFTDVTNCYFKIGCYNKTEIDAAGAAGTGKVRVYKMYLGAPAAPATPTKSWNSAQLDAATALLDSSYTSGARTARTLYLTTGVSTPDGATILKVVALTQAAYSALSTKAADTFYLITETPASITTVTVITSAAYSALSSKDPNTAYLLTG